MDDLVGEEIGDSYRIDRLIAKGGMGAVYRGVHLPTGREVAIKTMLPDKKPSADTLARFDREAKTAAALHHPHIVEVFHVGRLDNGTLFLVMELVEGALVGDLIERSELNPRRALIIARQALEGIGHVHGLGLVHRDLKPDNIMVIQRGQPGAEFDHVKLVDFGVVKLLDNAASAFGARNFTAIGAVFGTPQYMAPEQALAKDVDRRADIYSMGVVLFEMLTGRRPFESDELVKLLKMHIKTPAPRLADIAPEQPWWTAEMENLVAGALKKKPDNRWPSAPAMIGALEAAFLSVNHVPSDQE